MEEIKKIPFMLGDIGGTNIRLKLVSITQCTEPKLEEIFSKNYKTTPEVIVDTFKEFIAECEKTHSIKPKKAVLGLPGVVIGNTLVFSTNIPTLNSVSGEKLAEMLGIEEVTFLNDFNINGYAIQSEMLKEGEDYIKINPSVPRVEGESIGMIGPGTGLGIGYLTKQKGLKYYNVHSAEGGYTDFAPIDEIDLKYREFLLKKLDKKNIIIQDVCSGGTFKNSFLFFAEQKPENELSSKEKEILDQINSLNKENYAENSTKINKLIMNEALDPENKAEDSICKKVINLFVKNYASISANLSLFLLPYGGLYLLGGISTALVNYMKENDLFFNQFKTKGGLDVILTRIPIYVVINPNFGVFGAEVYAKKVVIDSLSLDKKSN